MPVEFIKFLRKPEKKKKKMLPKKASVWAQQVLVATVIGYNW